MQSLRIRKLFKCCIFHREGSYQNFKLNIYIFIYLSQQRIRTHDRILREIPSIPVFNVKKRNLCDLLGLYTNNLCMLQLIVWHRMTSLIYELKLINLLNHFIINYTEKKNIFGISGLLNIDRSKYSRPSRYQSS